MNNQDKSTWKGTRDGYGKGLLELGQKNKDVVVLSADLTSSTRADWFKEKFPDRFFSFGVAEQDMVSTAAGFALSGKIPFCCSFGVFASGRAWDQVRTSVAYMNLNVNIGGTHGGISVGPDGATHQALEEIALMRVLPHMSVVAPCDFLEAKKATVAAAYTPGPVYLRLSRENLPIITKEEDEFEIGKAKILKNGSDITIIACGIMVYQAMLADEILKKKNIEATIINLHTIKPLDAKAVINAAKKTKAVVTCEEHLLAGGMGSAVAELLSQNYPVPIEMIGVNDRFGESGSPWELMKKFHLMPEDIADACERAISRK
ncbi:MAG: transketolase family protein [Candidatus Omnitrophica bacterium]|nr:transketolase family protein [Candidatus Omnitrophota bacterium]